MCDRRDGCIKHHEVITLHPQAPIQPLTMPFGVYSTYPHPHPKCTCVWAGWQGVEQLLIMTGGVQAKACLAFTYTTEWLLRGCWYLSQPSAGLQEGKGGLTLCLYLCEGTDNMRERESEREELNQRSCGAPYVGTWIYKNLTAHKAVSPHPLKCNMGFFPATPSFTFM